MARSILNPPPSRRENAASHNDGSLPINARSCGRLGHLPLFALQQRDGSLVDGAAAFVLDVDLDRHRLARSEESLEDLRRQCRLSTQPERLLGGRAQGLHGRMHSGRSHHGRLPLDHDLDLIAELRLISRESQGIHRSYRCNDAPVCLISELPPDSSTATTSTLAPSVSHGATRPRDVGPPRRTVISLRVVVVLRVRPMQVTRHQRRWQLDSKREAIRALVEYLGQTGIA